jgi:hypothetical protein
VVLLGAMVFSGRSPPSRARVLPGATMRTYVHWTTKELGLLKEMHSDRMPSAKELAAVFPNHSEQAIMRVARIQKLRSQKRDWMKIANQHFSGRV